MSFFNSRYPTFGAFAFGAKQRTGFLKTASLGKFYPLGNYFATTVHLDELRNKVGKDKHGLRDCDVDLTDKMNYPSDERLCKQNVIDLLEQHVFSDVGSDATRFFLKLMLYPASSFLDPKLFPLSRVYWI